MVYIFEALRRLSHKNILEKNLELENSLTRMKEMEGALSKSKKKLWDNEIKTRSILNASHSATALLDRNGIILDCNLTYVARFGLTTEKIRGRYIWDFFPPEVLESRRRTILSVFETGKPLRGEENAGGVWNAYHLEPVTNEKGEVTAVVSEALDITSRKESEEKLGLNKELLRDVMDLAPAFICAKNLEGRFILVNKKLADFYGHSVEEMTDMLHSDLCEDKDELRSMLADDHEVIKAGAPLHIPEETMKNSDGSITVLDTYKIPFTAYDEPAVLITSSDITKRKQVEQSLEKLSNSLGEQVEKKTEELQNRIAKSEQSRRAMLYMVEDLNKTHGELQESRERALRSERLAAIGVLAGGVAHELRNSLGVLTNVAAYLNIAVPAENETVALNLRHMRDNVVRANRIITDLLDFSRDTAPNRSELLISNLIDDLLKEIDLPENITIERIHPKKSLPAVLADRDQILLIIRNLLTNAIDAMSLPYLDPPGGVITLDYAPTEDDDWIIKVTDTGIGIPAERINLIFEPLFTTKIRGIGLGLALSHRKAMSNGGNLEVESEEGVGSTFILTLERARIQTV
jgi:PAS domain S-box-containing protein